MANKRIKELELTTVVNDTDDFILEDAAKTKRISFSSLEKAVLNRLQVGGRNLLLDSGNIITKTSDYFVVAYETSSLKLNTKYTFVINGFTNSGNRLGVWFNNGNAGGYLFPSVNIPTTQYMTVTTPETLFTTDVHFYNYRQDTAQNATINWACMYEGEIKPPLDWTPAPEDIDSDIKGLENQIAKLDERIAKLEKMLQ